MRKSKSIFFIAALSLVFLSAFNIVRCVKCNQQKDDSKDSVKVDPFQVLIDEYCKAKSAESETKKILGEVNHRLELDKSEIERRKTDQEKYKKEKEEILSKPQTDSMLKANDTLKIIASLKNVNYDSLIKNNDTIIAALKKKNSQSEKDIDSLENELANCKNRVQTCLKNLKTFASRIRGGYSFNFCGIKYNIYVASLDSEEIRMHLFRKGKENFYSIGAVKEFLEHEKHEPLMITNAGMYTPSNEPEGLYIEEGSKVSYDLDTSKRNTGENFFLYPNGVFYLDSNKTAHIETTDDFHKMQKEGKAKPILATQSGPMLVINGNLHDKFTPGSRNEKIRSGVGIINNKKIVFAITINESNFYEFAAFFKDIFNCKDALFLDGAISQMYLKNINPALGGHFGPMISVSKKN